MKLLFDQNLSYRLATEIADLFPGSSHVRVVGLARAVDADVWSFAKTNDFVLVSKDSDFHQLSLALGAPPKVVWIRTGNASTDRVAALIRVQAADIAAFVVDPDAVFLALG